MPHKNPFSTTKTGMPYFDDMILNREYFFRDKGKVFKIVLMSPLKYLQICEKYQGPWQALRSQDKINRYALKLLEGADFHMPMYELDGKYFSQEGRHRAAAAQIAGMKKIPVLVVRNRRKSDILDPAYVGKDERSI